MKSAAKNTQLCTQSYEKGMERTMRQGKLSYRPSINFSNQSFLSRMYSSTRDEKKLKADDIML